MCLIFIKTPIGFYTKTEQGSDVLKGKIDEANAVKQLYLKVMIFYIVL